MISLIVSSSSSSSWGVLDGSKTGPTTERSIFRYETPLEESISLFSSTHSVDPVNPYSSASQLHKMMVLRGLHPCFCSTENLCANSIIAVVPLLGSAAPNFSVPVLRAHTSKKVCSSFSLASPHTTCGCHVHASTKDEEVLGRRGRRPWCASEAG